MYEIIKTINSDEITIQGVTKKTFYHARIDSKNKYTGIPFLNSFFSDCSIG